MIDRVAERLRAQLNQTTNFLVVCTHNSRRSHMGQVWLQAAAAWFGIPNVATFSAGTAATAFHPNAVKALQECGFQIEAQTESNNPQYIVNVSAEDAGTFAVSKTWEDASIPKKNLVVITVCSSAEANCPFIPGAVHRLQLGFEDPKASDGTDAQDAVYKERALEIGQAFFYLIQQSKPQ